MDRLGEYYGLLLVQDDDSPPSLVGSDESDERPPLEDDFNELENEIDNSVPFRSLPFTMYTTTSPTTTPALYLPPEGIVGVGVPVSTGEAPEGVHVCVSSEETPEGVCISVSPEEASVPSGERVEGLKEPARLGRLAGGASTTAQDFVKATTGGDVPSLSVSFFDDRDSPPSKSLFVDESEPSLSEFEFSQLTFTIQLKQTGTVKIFTASDLWDLVCGVHCECAHAGVKEVMAQLLFHFSFKLPLTTIRAYVARVLSSYPECPQVKGPVGFSISGVSFTKEAYVGARLHLDSLYLGASNCGPTH
uniref:Uncharacterized protein n=1 Tax=Chromera velia CCMP2878 TaxID=1169474 RepID=A0A0G4F2Q6_9ALVE|eukprot:Cvel_14690.t1-p1 / transcript=Cvel_14690.t1 / gene=Cvel_14690 / organism=Chromera_velia_CCMP2878 / gene_product=hypothetical protein / transcript_product=hypothetical protein / location=Cvel_scaffold1054:9428-10336(-) / protein_length=303 / sequence_SO=supercontig / SO=protein_coding / is_pseudo=false